MTGWAIAVGAGMLIAAAIGSGVWCVALLLEFIAGDDSSESPKRCVTFWALVALFVTAVSTLTWMNDTGLI